MSLFRVQRTDRYGGLTLITGIRVDSDVRELLRVRKGDADHKRDCWSIPMGIHLSSLSNDKHLSCDGVVLGSQCVEVHPT
jgi:hypothetical protein